MFVLRFIFCALSQCFAAYGNAGTQSKTFSFVLAVILNITAGECVCAESVFTLVFCALAAGDDAAFEACMVSDLDLIAVFSGINTALLGYRSMVGSDFALAVIATGTEAITYGNLCTGVLLFALISFSILYTLNA
ncbi:hypothetical protein M742_02620 [Neisseria gonorrhoeae NYC_2011_05_07]|nr:hypothetical protein M742_02620 [Neisseria gonorrhoeae NYC_2011_05_07]